ncbi:MAG: DUF1015 domain-containing protein [Spirochaetales bacterium]|nr:DUF1015 domain-containing protein [Spirochaetales bacterium]
MRWSVIACDQFTSDRDYWRAVEATVGEAPSTLRMILPEVYLEDGDVEARQTSTREAMRRYLDSDLLRSVPDSAVYVRRTLPGGSVRRGIVLALDLESYDYHKGSTTTVRASEETIPSRLPPRATTRRGAPLESPHVMVLFDDPGNLVVGGLESALADLERLYRTELMEGGGSIEGFRIPANHAAAEGLISGLEALRTPSEFGFLFAAGDGNHSLAAAKKIWEERKREGAGDDDPYRWCLVEIVNVHDEGLPFHPIHRLVAGDENLILETLLRTTDARFHGFARDRIEHHIETEGLSSSEIGIIGPHQSGILTVADDAGLAVGLVDAAIAGIEATSVDYVHGLGEVVEAASRDGATAIVVPAPDRSALFSTVSRDGALPRKAFSLGEARDKRYYLECRRLDGR